MLWNNLLQPVGSKSIEPMHFILEKFKCPSENAPYLFTNKNSRTYLATGHQWHLILYKLNRMIILFMFWLLIVFWLFFIVTIKLNWKPSNHFIRCAKDLWFTILICFDMSSVKNELILFLNWYHTWCIYQIIQVLYQN